MARVVAHLIAFLCAIIAIVLALLVGIPAAAAVDQDAGGTPRGQGIAALLVVLGLRDGEIVDDGAAWVARGMLAAIVLVLAVAFLVERAARPRAVNPGR
ncbi:hypothetical protein KZX37_01200 [Microbacterium sp. EYE_5]|uniref:hypothetical protein n=1 Tax=unclassified Microbacterium TaxID=2609290 RepID=UPI0020031EF4|nr:MULTISPECIES: hypothetical protein [unclassified Microbacterium]MCK6079233.1 hypothetical protein [Microbacterium sp. EYE_382]MCK6084503.1 hypothetical protein [Microbacterium sp. EYE_384]MCK6123268.1 hypothetical protein [Microbacterium sp. EYE_80]MCK6125267.1 hypothetical protein [Microbacterium sp. EYE_79]MCK6140187.1 hypothetical protein [Microbacterium sp. EYE_39]